MFYCKLILLLLAWASVAAAAPLTLTRGESAVLVLAESPTPSARFAAQELETALRKTLDISSVIRTDREPLPASGPVFLIGPGRYSQLPELPYDHFRIKRQGHTIQLAGRDDERQPLALRFMARTGTLYAVYHFMYDKLGVRMIWPGEDGIIYPRHEQLSVDELDLTDGPALPIRNAYYGNGARHGQESLEKMVRWGRFNGMGCSKLGGAGHASSVAIGTAYYDEHPEYYALIKGVRPRPVGNRWKLCHSNPDLPGLFAAWGIGHQIGGPYVIEDYFPVSANDSSGWCECPECLKLDAGQKSAYHAEICVSGRMFTLANRTAQEVKRRGSAKEVAMYAYAAYVDPPAEIPRLEDNIILFLARGISWNTAPAEAAKFQQLLEQWSQKTNKIVLRDYRNNSCPLIIFPYPSLAHRTIQYLNRHFSGFQGIDICGDDTRASALWGPTGYVYARLLWNPQQELEPILDDFYRIGWPESHTLIRRYFEYFEQRVQSVITESGQRFWPWKAGDDLLTARRIMNEEAFRTGYDLLAQATAAAGSPEEKQRIEFLKTGLDAVKVDQEYYDALMRVAAFSGSLLNIPSHPEAEPTADKKELLRRAGDAIRRRNDFLTMNRDHEGIPSSPLIHPQARYTVDWANTIDYLTKFYAGKSDTVQLLADGWRFQIDPENKGAREGWFKSDFSEVDWVPITTNAPWEQQGFGPDKFPATKGYDGWGWYRRTLEIPADWKSGRLLLTLGAVDESFDLYLDGQLKHSFRYDPAKEPNAWSRPHVIDLSACLPPGKHQLTIAVHDRGGAGGIWKPCSLQWEKNNLLPGDFSKYTATDLKVSGNQLEVTSNSNGSLSIAVADGPGTYTAAVEFQNQSTKIFYKVPVSLRVTFKNSAGKTIGEQPAIGFSRNNLRPDTVHRLELNFQAPPETTRIVLRLSLRVDRVALKSFRLEAD